MQISHPFDSGRAQDVAIGLGVFSIALGALELLAARPMARALGMRGSENLLRIYGLREIGVGVGLIAGRRRAPWLRARVAGDALDLATLAACARNNPRRENLALAAGAVAGVTALDVMTARALSSPDFPKARLQAVRDYSDRAGFPQGLASARGAALDDFEMPRDMRPPQALRPRMR
jgi:hypothetical protein